MSRRIASTVALTPLLAVLGSACSSTTPTPSGHYEEYVCPAPIGHIVREDCSQAALRYEGVDMSAHVGVGQVGGGAAYKDQAIRQANDLIAVLKEQRVSLCHDFNTCKLTIDQYRTDKQRIESSFTAVVALKGNVDRMDQAGAMQFMEQLRSIREGKNETPPAGAPTQMALVTPPPAPPPPKPAEPTPAPTPAPAADGSWAPGKFMIQAVGRVADAAKNIEAKSNIGFDVDHACLLGAYLMKGKSIDIVQSFKAGRQYVLLGGGSDNAIDVDLGILDSNNKLIIADTDDDPSPMVKFKPVKDGNYTIRLALEKSKSNGNFVALAIMHEGGYNIPTKNFVASIGRAIMNANAVSKKVGAKGMDLVFHEQGNWALYGTVLKPGEVSTFGGLTLVTDPTIALAGADEDGTNIDLFIKDQRASKVVAKDDDPDATPAVLVSPEAGKMYSLSVANAAKTGTTMATALLLDVKR
jgi:hypothetical protein